MSQAARKRSLVLVDRPEALETQGFEVVTDAFNDVDGEAARRAELEAAFAMFGTLETVEDGEYADAPFRADALAELIPANDIAPDRRMPVLDRRGLHIDPKLPIQLIQTLDWLVIAAAADVAAHWGAGLGLLQMNIAAGASFMLTAVSLKVGLWITDAYRTSPATIRAERGLGGLTLGAFIGLMAANALAPNARDAGALSATLPFAAMLLAGIHAAFAVWIRAAHKKGVFSETIVVIGATDAAERFVKHANKTGEARIITIADDRLQRAPQALAGAEVGGDLDALLAWPSLPHVDRIVIAVPQRAEDRVHAIIARLKALPNRVDLLLNYQTHGVRGRGIDRVGGAPVACVSGRSRKAGRALAKRAQDVLLGGALFVFVAPLLALIAAAVKLETRGPALRRERHYGFNNSNIQALMFRTQGMNGGVTRVGGFLRRSGLESLPQLINVLRGEMSLVGPCSHAVGLTAADRALDDIVSEYAHRHRVKPGLTGWAQINGACGALQTPGCVRKRVRLDLEYVARASLWFDLQIIARTAMILFGAKRSQL